MAYSKEDIDAAREMVTDLMSFTNQQVARVANVKKVSDKSRMPMITELVVKEFGEAMIPKVLSNMQIFGADTICKVTNYRKPSSAE